MFCGLVTAVFAAITLVVLIGCTTPARADSLAYPYLECVKVDPVKNDWFQLSAAYGRYLIYTRQFLPTLDYDCEFVGKNPEPVEICSPAALDPSPPVTEPHPESEVVFLIYRVKCAAGRYDDPIEVSSDLGTGGIHIRSGGRSRKLLVPVMMWE